MSGEKKVTIQDIADLANVSISTVSRVLTGNAPVNAGKRTAVLQAVEALNYRRNSFARSLASGQSLTIGVITQSFGSPFYDSILGGILQGLEESAYSALFADGRWQVEVEREAVQTLLDRQVDGLIIVGGLLPNEELTEIAQQTLLIMASRLVPQLEDHCLYVDNFQAAYEATEYLLSLGHQQIAHIMGIPTHIDSKSRLAGYEQALRAHGVEPDPELVVEGDFWSASGVLAVERLLSQKRPFSAIFAANDQMAYGARLHLSRRGIRVPDDVSIVGFDDQPTSAYVTPPLTTMRQPGTALGQAAAETIIKHMSGEPCTSPPFKAKLILRESAVARR